MIALNCFSMYLLCFTGSGWYEMDSTGILLNLGSVLSFLGLLVSELPHRSHNYSDLMGSAFFCSFVFSLLRSTFSDYPFLNSVLVGAIDDFENAGSNYMLTCVYYIIYFVFFNLC